MKQSDILARVRVAKSMKMHLVNDELAELILNEAFPRFKNTKNSSTLKSRKRRTLANLKAQEKTIQALNNLTSSRP